MSEEPAALSDRDEPARRPVMTISMLWLTRRERRWTTPALREALRGIGARRPRLAAPVPPVAAPVAAIAVRRPAPRPAPALRSTAGRSAPVGNFAASAIPNDRLGPSDIPPNGASWDAVADFALSYDGYAYWDNLPNLASTSVQRWTRDRTLPDTLHELRACLFYEHRRWHHFGEEPSGRAAEYVWAIVEAIRAVTTTQPRSPGAASSHTVATPDPRAAVASEAHVTIIPTRLDGARAPAAVANPPATRRPRPRPARPTLQPRRAGETHVQLVPGTRSLGAVVALRSTAATAQPDPWGALTSAVLANVKARHPSAGVVEQPAPEHDDAVHVLLPMPSPEALPKPSVIERRRPVDGSRAATQGPGARVVPLLPRLDGAVRCQTFACDDDGYDAWLGANPQGYVLNVGAHRTKAVATLHRAVCPTVTTTRRGQAMTGTPKVCDTSRQALHRWAVMQDAEPASCRRCLP